METDGKTLRGTLSRMTVHSLTLKRRVIHSRFMYKERGRCHQGRRLVETDGNSLPGTLSIVTLHSQTLKRRVIHIIFMHIEKYITNKNGDLRPCLAR